LLLVVARLDLLLHRPTWSLRLREAVLFCSQALPNFGCADQYRSRLFVLQLRRGSQAFRGVTPGLVSSARHDTNLLSGETKGNPANKGHEGGGAPDARCSDGPGPPKSLAVRRRAFWPRPPPLHPDKADRPPLIRSKNGANLIPRCCPLQKQCPPQPVDELCWLKNICHFQQLRNRRLYVGNSPYEVGQIFLSLWYTA